MRLVVSNLPSVWRQRSREEEAFRKKCREEVRGDHWMLSQGTQRSLRTAGWRKTHIYTERTKGSFVWQSNRVSARLTEISARTWESHGYKNTQFSKDLSSTDRRGHTASADGVGCIDMIHTLTCLPNRGCTETRAQHIWSLSDATQCCALPHVDVIRSPWMQESSCTMESEYLGFNGLWLVSTGHLSSTGIF